MKKMLCLVGFTLTAVGWMASAVAQQQVNVSYRISKNGVDQPAGGSVWIDNNTQTAVKQLSSVGETAECHASPLGGMKLSNWGHGLGSTVSAASSASPNWTESTSSSYTWTYESGAEAYVRIRAVFDYISYKVEYKSNIGSAPSAETRLYNETNALALVTGIPDGYEFVKWDATSDDVTLPRSAFAAEEKVGGADFGLQSLHQDGAVITLAAQIDPKTYAATAEGENCTVSWSQKTGTYDEELELTWSYGSAYQFVSMTVYAGSDTTGKKLREYTSEPAAFKMSESNAYYDKVYVKVVCEKKTYDLTVDPNGGSYNGMKHVQVVGKLIAGETSLNRLDVPVHTNCFDGYWDTKFGGNKVYDANGRFHPGTYWDTEGRFIGTADLTVYALWGDPLPTHQVHLAVRPTDAGVIRADYSGVQTTSNDFALTVVENFSFEMTASSTNSGYSFSCWTNSLGQATNDNPWISAVTSDVANVAVFTGNVYKVTYHGGEGVPSEQVKFVSFGGTYGEPETPVTAEGKAVEGWYRNSECAEESRVNPTDKVGLGDIDLYAKWRDLGTYTIRFDKNDEKAEGTMDDQTPFCETETALNTNCYTKTGYHFSHWTDDGGTNYLDGAIVKDLVASNDTKALYAVWSNNVYWVDYNPNGGTVSLSSQPFTYDKPQDIACEPTHSAGLVFAGWSTNGVDVAVTNHESVVNLCTGGVGDERIMLLALWKQEDVGAYSDAMHCDNLRWEPVGGLQAAGGTAWATVKGQEAGLKAKGKYSGSEVTGMIPPNFTMTDRLVATVTPPGKLSFCAKANGSETLSLTLEYRVDAKGEWKELKSWSWSEDFGRMNNTYNLCVTNALPADSCQISFVVIGSPSQSISLDQVKWMPDGTPESPAPGLTNAVPTAVTGLVYNGGAQTGVGAGANYTIVGNVATNAGEYTAVATVTNGTWEGGSFAPTNIQWTIGKAAAPDVSGVSFADATYEYDGESHSIAVSGTVPEGVEVVYSGDPTNRTEVGVNTVTASFKVLDEVNYEAITTQLVARLTIKKDPPPEPVATNAVPTAATGLVYNGGAQTGVAAGANYTIVGNVATNAGEYVATATVTNGVWEGGATGETNVTWTIAKAPAPDVSGVTFVDATFEYDGESHSIAVSGTVPAGVEVVYSGDATNRTEVGTNTVTASFKVLDTNNYEAITTQLTAKLIITEREEPPDPTVAYENIYFSATLAELGADAVPTNRKITIKAEGLPKGLKLVTTTLKDAKKKVMGYAYTVEGAPTETMDGLSRIAYVRVTDNKVQTLYALDLSVLWAKAYEDKSFPDGEVKSAYANFSVAKLWPDVAVHPKNWTFSGWPAGIKFTTKAVTARKKIDGVYVTQTNALPYEVYGTPTKAGRFTVKAVEKIAGTSYKSTHVATFTVWPEGEVGEEWTDQAYVGVYRKSAESVKSASGLPTGVKFTAKDIVSKGVVTTQAHHFYGTPTKAGTYAVTLTHEDKSKTQFLWTITPAEAPVFELALSETEVDPETAKATIRLGVDYNWAVSNTPGSKVTASGLPTGLKLSSMAVKEGTKTVGYTYAVAGVPTKAGEYLATFKTTWNGVTVLQTAAFTVLELPDWAKGTFDGGADETFPVGGQVSFTVSKTGKLSGKWMSGGTNWTLSAASYGRYDDATASYVAQVVGKAGSGKTARIVTNELSVAADAVGGLASNELFLAYQNNWKLEPWKSLGKKVAKAPMFEFRPYADAGDDHTNDTISLKFAATGKVTVKASYFKSVSSAGKISWTTVSGSAVLCPQTQPDGEAFPAVVFVYLPPKKGTPTADGAYAACVRLRWSGEKFVEWADPE